MGCGAAGALGQTPSFNFVGSPFGSDSSSYLFGLSADGRVATGVSQSANASRGFFWTPSSGRVDFPPRLESHAYAVSGDGLFAVGGQALAFRYSQAGGFQDLGRDTSFPFAYSRATAASQDGSVIVGIVSNTVGAGGAAFHWTVATGLVPMYQFGTFGATAVAVSRDGSVMAGTADG